MSLADGYAVPRLVAFIHLARILDVHQWWWASKSRFKVDFLAFFCQFSRQSDGQSGCERATTLPAPSFARLILQFAVSRASGSSQSPATEQVALDTSFVAASRMDGASTVNQHFKKRKARSSSAPISPRRAAASSPLLPHTSSGASSRASSPAPMPGGISSDGINLSAALTALKVSLKREMESFLPPTPAASPIHSRSAKRPRFDSGASLPDPTETKIVTPNITRPKASPAPKLRGTAFLSVSKSLQQELDRRSRPDSSEVMLRARKRRQQLSYFAIARAFHRAAHERELALVPATPVE